MAVVHASELSLRVAPTRRARLARSWQRNRFAYALIAPAVVFMVVVHLLPTAAGLFLSTLRLNTFTFSMLFDAPRVGLQNYRDVLFDELNPVHAGFTNAVVNTIQYTAWTVGATLVAGMGIALLLNRDFPFKRTVRTLMIVPWVVPSFVVAILWQFMWVSDSGIVNHVLVDWLHIVDKDPVWLLGPNSMWAIVIPSIWRALPFTILIFLAGLAAVPTELHEAATVDGANAWQRFRWITLPLLKPLIAIQLLFGVIYSVYQFAIPYVMMGTNPGPYADLVMTLVVRQTFTNNLFGYGAAISSLLMFAMLGWVAVWYFSFRRSLQEEYA